MSEHRMPRPLIVTVATAAALSLSGYALGQAVAPNGGLGAGMGLAAESGKMNAVIRVLDATTRVVTLDNDQTFELAPNVAIDTIMIGKPVTLTFKTEGDKHFIIDLVEIRD